MKGKVNVGGIDTSDANASASHILSGKTAYKDGNKITGTMRNRTGGYTTDSLTKSGNELRMSVPDAGYYSDGAYIKSADNDWVGSNIRQGKNVFGKTGTFTSDATASTAHILRGKTAYKDGNKITGTMSIRTSGYTTDNLSKNGNELRMSIPDAGYYSDGAYIKNVDNDWVESNIRQGKNVFGKTGNFTGDGDIKAGDVMFGKIAYAKGNRIIGDKKTFKKEIRNITCRPSVGSGEHYINVYANGYINIPPECKVITMKVLNKSGSIRYDPSGGHGGWESRDGFIRMNAMALFDIDNKKGGGDFYQTVEGTDRVKIQFKVADDHWYSSSSPHGSITLNSEVCYYYK